MLVAVRVMHRIAVKLSSMLGRTLAARRESARVSLAIVEMMVNMAVEISRAVKPGSRADKNSAGEPFRAIITVRGAIVRRLLVVTVRTNWRFANVNGNLCRGALRRNQG